MTLNPLARIGILAPTTLVALASVLAGPVNAGTAASSCGEATGSGSTYTQDSGDVVKKGVSFASTEDDENAVLVTGGTLQLRHSAVTKSGDSSDTHDSSLYGLNAAVLAESGGKVEVSGTDIVSSGIGGNGLFATGEGSV